MARGGLAKEFSEELTCSICLEFFTDPVITECGHNFCRACLTQSWGSGNASCPECREPLQRSSLRPNRKLANMAEISKKVRLPEAKGSKDAGRVCERHQEPLKLFCREDEAPICLVCERSKEHKEHRVIPADEAADEYKEKIQAQLLSLAKEKEKLVKLKLAEEQRSQECLEQLEEQKQKTTSVFKEMHKFLEEKERFQLTRLAGLEKEIKKRQEENLARLSEEISHFSALIEDVEAKCQQLPAEFLQDIRRTLSRCQEGQVRQQLELSPGLEWRLRSSCPQKSVLKKAMEELEGSLTQGPSKGSVTLDADTAHRYLVLSEDLKRVRWGDKQNVRDNPERFDVIPCVLGRERFTSGRHFWEVEVEKMGKGGWWFVGVAQESLKRKGKLNIHPPEKVWAVGKVSSQPDPLLGCTTAPKTLTLPREPRKIRVFLDYEEGRVEFFDADTDSLIFTFPPASFFGEGIRPFFHVYYGACLQC